jgi:hypothetical protein
MGVVSANLEVASDAPVIQAILGNTAMKVSYISESMYRCLMTYKVFVFPRVLA